MADEAVLQCEIDIGARRVLHVLRGTVLGHTACDNCRVPTNTLARHARAAAHHGAFVGRPARGSADIFVRVAPTQSRLPLTERATTFRTVTEHSLVDPELVPFLGAVPSFDFRPETLADTRRDAAGTIAPPPVAGPPVTREELSVPGPEGAPPVRVLVYRPVAPSTTKLPVLLHCHGGGFVLLGPEATDGRNRFRAGDLGCLVVSVDYRLAPETPFPGPIEDCYAVLTWLYRNAEALNVDTTRIAVGGESAGGGLAASLALMARERNEVPLAFQLLIYPMLDDRTGTVPPAEKNASTGAVMWTADNNRFGWRALLGREPGTGSVSPYCAAARATSVAGLPPALLQVGALDILADETIDYAHRLIRAGVPTELQVYPGFFHGADLLPGTRLGQRFATDHNEALRRAFARPSK